jgi:hypothetical protein
MLQPYAIFLTPASAPKDAQILDTVLRIRHHEFRPNLLVLKPNCHLIDSKAVEPELMRNTTLAWGVQSTNACNGQLLAHFGFC